MAKSGYPRWDIPDDWTEEDGYIAILFCIPNSREWRGLITAHINTLTYGRAWNEATGKITDVQAIAREIFNSMAICDIDSKLERIAAALESIEQKAIARYTYEEFIEDLEDAFGVGSILVTLVNSLLGLMPNLQAKVDFTNLMQSFIETYTRWKPLHGLLATQSASLGAIAATQATSKILSLIGLVFQALDVVGNGWRSLILGDKNLWDDFLKPLWASFISSGDGGEGGEDPDKDPDNRISLQLTNQIVINNTVNALCCGAVETMQESLGAGYIETVDSTEIVPGGTVPTSPNITWTNQTNPTDEKCQAARFIVNWLIAFYGRAEWVGVQPGTSSFLLTSILRSVLAAVPPIGVTLVGLSSYIGQALAYLATGNTEIFTTIHASLLNVQEELVCALYDSSDVASAKSAFLGILEGSGVNPLDTWAVGIFLEQNNILGLLWFDNDLVDYSSESSDCSGCEGIAAECSDMHLEEFTLHSVFNGTNYYLNIKDRIAAESGWTFASIEDCLIRIASSPAPVLDGWNGPGPGNFVASVYNCDGSLRTNLLSPPMSGANMAAWNSASGWYEGQIRSSTTPFTLTVTIEVMGSCP